MWWVGVSPSHHGGGAGQAILSNVERDVAALGARLIVIKTSDHEALARARNYYLKRSYEERGRIPDFYAEGD